MPPTVVVSTSHKLSEAVVRVTALMVVKQIEVGKNGYRCCFLLKITLPVQSCYWLVFLNYISKQ